MAGLLHVGNRKHCFREGYVLKSMAFGSGPLSAPVDLRLCGGGERRQRPAILLPENFTIDRVAEDELYNNKHKISLSFSLPRGGYATLITKRLEAGVQPNKERKP